MDEPSEVKFVAKQHISLPEVIVLSMNMHGIIEIPGFPELERMSSLKRKRPISDLLHPIYVERIPKEMTLIKMNATALGVPNYQRMEEAIKYNQLIMDVLEKYPRIKAGTERDISICEQFVREVAGLIKDEYIKYHLTHCSDATPSDACLKTYFDGRQEDLPIRQAFIQQLLSPFSYTTKVYHSGDRFTNKAYTRETQHMRAFEKKFSKDLECTILNKYGQKDLLGLLSPQLKVVDAAQLEDEHYLHLSNIIHALKLYGVKTILLFDLTCSVLADKNTFYYLGNDYPRLQNIYTIEDLESRLLTQNPENFPGGSRFKRRKRSHKIVRKGKKSKHDLL